MPDNNYLSSKPPMGFPSWESFAQAMRAVNQVRFVPLRARWGILTAPDLSINHVQPDDYACLNKENRIA